MSPIALPAEPATELEIELEVTTPAMVLVVVPQVKLLPEFTTQAATAQDCEPGSAIPA